MRLTGTRASQPLSEHTGGEDKGTILQVLTINHEHHTGWGFKHKARLIQPRQHTMGHSSNLERKYLSINIEIVFPVQPQP